MRRFLICAAAACALAGPALAAESPNAPPSGAKVTPQIAVGDLGMAIMSAAINADGTVARGEGVTSAANLGTGLYEVAFGRDITACVYSATVGESGVGGASPSVIGVTRRSGNPNGVFLQIKNPPDEVSEDKAFFVLVYCGR